MNQAHLLYFVTGSADVPAYAQDVRPLTMRGPAQGPAGPLTGTLKTPCSGVMILDYHPGQQWVKLSDGEAGQVWLGLDLDVKLDPRQLMRDRSRKGHVVKLGDGQLWEIPPARLAMGGSGLPRRRVLQADGTAAWAVEPAYRGLTTAAERLWNARQGHTEMITEDELDQIAGEALSVNYRIQHREAIALGLLTDDAFRGVIDALLDWPVIQQFIEAEKKNLPPVT